MNGTSLHAIYKYGIAFKVPIHGSISFALLAERCDIPKVDLQRILRFAMVWHRVFCEPKNGFVAHTAASRQLAEDPRAHDMAGLMFDKDWQAMSRVRLPTSRNVDVEVWLADSNSTRRLKQCKSLGATSQMKLYLLYFAIRFFLLDGCLLTV